MPTRTPFLSGPSPVSSRAFQKKRVSSNRPPGLSRSSQPAPLLSPHLLLGGELSDRETSGRAAVTVPADACGQRRIRSRTRKLPILPDRTGMHALLEKTNKTLTDSPATRSCMHPYRALRVMVGQARHTRCHCGGSSGGSPALSVRSHYTTKQRARFRGGWTMFQARP